MVFRLALGDELVMRWDAGPERWGGLMISALGTSERICIVLLLSERCLL